jgi:hypothetical protein
MSPVRQPSTRARGASRRPAVNLGRPHEALVEHHIVAIVKPNMAERKFAETPHRLSLPCRNDKIARLILLKHQPHRFDIIAGETPIAL